MRNVAAVMSENQKLRRQAADLRRIVKRLTLDLCLATGARVTRAILWPAGLREVESLTLAIGVGKDVLMPQERLNFLDRPEAEVDGSVVLMLLNPQEKAQPAPEPEAHSALCSAQAGPLAECPVCGPR